MIPAAGVLTMRRAPGLAAAMLTPWTNRHRRLARQRMAQKPKRLELRPAARRYNTSRLGLQHRHTPRLWDINDRMPF